MITQVLNLDTNQHLSFSLPPDQAVIAAYEHDQGNHNTWDYPSSKHHKAILYGKRTVSCGKFTAILNASAFEVV